MNWLFMSGIFVFIVLVAGMELFGCSNRPAVSGVFDDNTQSLASRDATESSGIFEGADGRLNSDELCYNNESCVEMCHSMLKNFSDQKRCYSYQEVDVQAFRDTYNKLALGRRLSSVDRDEMESFLDFGAEMWRDAITGFERDWDNGCEVAADERVSDCQGRDYYLQRGYTRQSAADALSWIARSDWLAKLLLDYDNNYVVMDALVSVLIDPEIPQKYEAFVNSADRNTESIDSINAVPDGELCQDYSDNVKGLADTTKTEAFNVPCLDQDLNYRLLAKKYDNEESILLGNRYCSHLDDDCIATTAAIFIAIAQGESNMYSFICNLLRDAGMINSCGSNECTDCRNFREVIDSEISACDASPVTSTEPCSS